MAAFKNIVNFFVLIALFSVCLCQVSQGGPHESQGGPHQNQGRTRRQISESEDDVDQNNAIIDQAGPNAPQNLQSWTTCDFTAVTKISCQDCHTRLICKPIGGLIKACNNPYRPYCNLGVCSATPSAGCA